jgi:hypothetical protein
MTEFTIQYGWKVFGNKWRATIDGVPEIMERLEEACAAEDGTAAQEGVTALAALIRPVMERLNTERYDLDLLNYLETEDVAEAFDAEGMEEWRDEFNATLEGLHDWADYYRVWITPHKKKPAG